MNFLDFLISLAPEGETALIVRQKPQLKDGQMQFFPDGAIKCTWPAMLPTAKIKPEWAIYGNTASFIVDRFKDGQRGGHTISAGHHINMLYGQP